MQMEVTDTPRDEDEAFIIAKTRAYNATFAKNDVRSLCVFVRGENEALVGA